MNATYALLVGIGLTASAFAQDPADPPAQPGISGAVQKAIEEFNRRKKEANTKANEVVVVLDPPAPPAEESKEESPEADALEEETTPAEATTEPADTENDAKPLLVTGKPPVDADDKDEVPQDEKKEELSPEPVVEPEAEPQEPETPAEPALEVRVESIRKGTGSINPSQVKLKASFPAKPLSTAPDGWMLERSEQAPVFLMDVELQPGTTISLSIRPHVLSPDSDGLNTFSVGEPGFEAAYGYLQENTVSAILGTSVAQLDRDSLQLGNAISELHRLLASLPKTQEPEQPEIP